VAKQAGHRTRNPPCGNAPHQPEPLRVLAHNSTSFEISPVDEVFNRVSSPDMQVFSETKNCLDTMLRMVAAVNSTYDLLYQGEFIDATGGVIPICKLPG
jgi:hypothetical protein